MGRFLPIYIRRSDGKSSITNRHRAAEANAPTKDQLDKTPNKDGISDYYRLVDVDETKHLDWRRKLGGMLARDLGHSDSDKGYMLVTFPENYQLYEHVKRAEEGSTGIKAVKNHAGGGNERQDAYLYGHPMGRKKRFRSPADFYPHLLWLATDEEGDPDNCSCKICCPEEIDDKLLGGTKKAAAETSGTVAAAKQETGQRPVAQAMARQPSQTDSKANGKKPAAVPSAAPPRPESYIKNEDQRWDLTYGVCLFRQGEVVWFNRGTRWGLGVVTRRWFQVDKLSVPQPVYVVQPLSHPHHNPPTETVTSETMLRPWLAWSVPGFTHQGLSPSVTFASADWLGLLSKKYGEGDLEVDGSILAAKAIDQSYCLCYPQETKPRNGGSTTAYLGMYLGAEKIWLGDPVRLRPDPNNGTNANGLDVLVLRGITETTMMINNNTSSRTLTLLGDIYSPRQTTAASPQYPDSLPSRMKQDLNVRNSSSIAAKKATMIYVLTTPNAAVSAKQIKGRWYEASRLGPVMSGEDVWRAELIKGDVGEIGARMNGRGDCHKGQVVEDVREDRRGQSWTGAVPQGWTVVDGDRKEPVPPPRGTGQGSTQAQVAVRGQVQAAGDPMEEFMDLGA